MKVLFFVTPDLETRLVRIGLSGVVRAISIEELLSLRGSEVSRTTSFGAERQFSGSLIAGCILGEVDATVRPSLEAAAKSLSMPASGRTACFHAREGKDHELIAWIVGRLLDVASASALESSRAALQLGRLRTALAQSENSLRRIQDCAPFDSGTALVFQIPTDGGSRQLTQQPMEQWVAECADALHGFDLILKIRPGFSDVTVLVELIGSNTGLTIAAWRVSEMALRHGWNRFDCPTSAESLNEPFVIRIHANTAGSRVEVGTGDPRLSPSSDRTGPVHPLALRVWGGVLGVRAARSGIGHAPYGEGPPRSASRVSASDLLTFASALKQSQAKLVRWLADPGALEVHPNGPVPVVAVVRGLEAKDMVGLRATVTLAHPEAEATEFALYACPSGTVAFFGRRAGKRRNSAVMRWLSPSGDAVVPSDGLTWLLLRAEETGEVRFRASAPLSGSIDVFFVTRNVENRNHFSWALFRSVTAEYVVDAALADSI